MPLKTKKPNTSYNWRFFKCFFFFIDILFDKTASYNWCLVSGFLAVKKYFQIDNNLNSFVSVCVCVY